MYPIFFQKGLITVYSYGLLLAIGFSVILWLSRRQASRYGFKKSFVEDFCFLMLVSGIFGARLFYVIQEWWYYKDHWLEFFFFHRGGLVFYGGLLGGILIPFCFVKIKKYSLKDIINFFLPYIPLGQFFGRLGCFFNGCCGGYWSGSFYYPVQLFESISCLVLSLFLFYLRAKKKQVNFLFIYLFSYGIIRYIGECYRGDQVPMWKGLRISQWMSLLFMVFIIGFEVSLLCKKKYLLLRQSKKKDND